MNSDPYIAAQSGDTAVEADHNAGSLPLNTLECLSGDLQKHEPKRLPVPQQIGDYELLDEIARGGMGVVYKARQQSLGRTVALKMILDSQLVSDQQIKRFHGEAEAAARLDHSGIVSVYEVGEVDGRHFFSMALVEGGSLQKLIARGPIAPQAAAEMVAQIAAAVEYAHQQGVVHRDLKPQNILLDKQGQPKVSDFGLARRLDATDGLTASGDVVGTPGYMSPEQAQGRIHELGPLVDVYALGAILYCLLTGRPPFQAATLGETLRQISEQEPVSPQLLNPQTPLDLETICLKALQKDAARRYPTAQALSDDLQRFVRGEPILARPISAWEKAWRFCRRQPALAGLMGAAAAMVVGGIALVIVVAQLLVAGANAKTQKAELDSLQFAAKVNDAELLAQRQIADTQKYYALLAEVRQNSAARQLGWTWINQQKLAEAAALDTPAVDAVELRTQSAECLGAFDLREVSTLDSTQHTAVIACAPNGKWVALAQLKDWLACIVLVRSLPDGAVLHKLRFPSSPLFQAASTRQDGVLCLAVSDDSRWIAVGARSGMVHLWDLQAKETQAKEIQPRSWQCDEIDTDGVRFHPDGQRLLTCSGKGVLKSWSLDDLQATVVEADLGDWSNLPLDSKGELFVSSRAVHSTRDFARLAELEQSARRMALHPNGRLLAQAGGTSLRLTNVSTGRVYRELIDQDLKRAHENHVASIAFHPQGSWLASCDNQQLKVWEVASGALLASLVIGPCEEGRAAFTVDGRRLIVTGQRKTVLYEVGGLMAQSFLAQEPFPITAIDVAHDHRGLACLSEGIRSPAGDDQAEVSTWSLDSSAEQARAALHVMRSSEAAVSPSLAFDRQGKFLAAAPTTGDLCLLSTAAGEALASIGDSRTPRTGAIAFAPDGARLWGVAPGDEIVARHVPSLEVAGRYKNVISGKLFGSSLVTALETCGDEAIVATSDKHLNRLSTEGVKLAGAISLDQSPSALAVAPDQTWCAVGTLNRELRLMTLPGGEQQWNREAHSDSVLAIAISDDQAWLASAGKGRQLHLWRRSGDKLDRYLSLELPGRVRAIRFSPAADKLLVLLDEERAVRVWNLKRL